MARCLQSAANAEQSATRSRDCGVYLLLHLSARRACAEMRCRYAAPAHWCSSANCETFRIPALMSKRTILIPNEAGWTRGRGLSLRRCDCVAFEQIYGLPRLIWHKCRIYVLKHFLTSKLELYAILFPSYFQVC